MKTDIEEVVKRVRQEINDFQYLNTTPIGKLNEFEVNLWIKEITTLTDKVRDEAHQAGRDEEREKMGTLVEQKFPRGERQWCIQCAKRLRKALQDNK